MYRISVGSYAEISLISPRRVQANWETTELLAASVYMSGIGGKEMATKSLDLNMKLQWGQPDVGMRMYVGDMPEGVDILMGLDIQDRLGF